MAFNPTCLTIFVSELCNLSCKYCYSTGDKANRKIGIDFVLAGLKYFAKNEPTFTLRLFGGGEPTCDFNNLKNIVKTARNVVGSKMLIEMQSNGYFSKSVAKWINTNLDMIWISCDGPADLQNKYRPTIGGKKTSRTVMSNIKYFSNSKSIKLGVRSTITSESCVRQNELIEYFHRLGVKLLCFDPIFMPVSKNKHLLDFYKTHKIKSPTSFVKNFIKAYNRATQLGVSLNSILIPNVQLNNSYGCRGCFNNPHLTTDGHVSCCEMASSIDSPLHEMIFGTYDKNKIICDHNMIENIMLKRKMHLARCANCECQHICCGGCVGEAYNETKNVLGVKDFNCIATTFLYKKLKKQFHNVIHS